MAGAGRGGPGLAGGGRWQVTLSCTVTTPGRPGPALPAWRSVPVVAAHPDDETFGLAWTLPAAIVGRLEAETGASFADRPASRIDICVPVSRARQRRAALLHASRSPRPRCCGGACSY